VLVVRLAQTRVADFLGTVTTRARTRLTLASQPEDSGTTPCSGWPPRARGCARRRAILWPLLVPPVIVTASMLVSYGQVRHRVICEPIVVVLAAQFLTSRVRATAVG
jgi:hypothetical protein